MTASKSSLSKAKVSPYPLFAELHSRWQVEDVTSRVLIHPRDPGMSTAIARELMPVESDGETIEWGFIRPLSVESGLQRSLEGSATSYLSTLSEYHVGMDSGSDRINSINSIVPLSSSAGGNHVTLGLLYRLGKLLHQTSDAISDVVDDYLSVSDSRHRQQELFHFFFTRYYTGGGVFVGQASSPSTEQQQSSDTLQAFMNMLSCPILVLPNDENKTTSGGCPDLHKCSTSENKHPFNKEYTSFRDPLCMRMYSCLLLGAGNSVEEWTWCLEM